jgi:hypothetical protein
MIDQPFNPRRETMKASLAATCAAMIALALTAGVAEARMANGSAASAPSHAMSPGIVPQGGLGMESPGSLLPGGIPNALNFTMPSKGGVKRMKDREEEDPPQNEPDKPNGDKPTKVSDSPTVERPPHHNMPAKPPTEGKRPRPVGGVCAYTPC